jgi:hypothetical protein
MTVPSKVTSQDEHRLRGSPVSRAKSYTNDTGMRPKDLEVEESERKSLRSLLRARINIENIL